MEAPITPGTVLAEKYRIERELGSGGMARVFEVMHLQLGERAAIKVLRPEVAHMDGVVERFSREAKAMSRLKSEHVARVMDIGQLPGGEPYMVMELLEGSDLSEVLEAHGAFAPTDAVDIMLQACEAIAEAHSRGIVHRDLKPSNLFLTHRADGTPSVKVLDFGISKFAGGDAADSMSLTHTRALLGSPLYMAPEQIASARDADERADQWGLGTILFEILASAPPFQAQTLRHLQFKILHEQPRSLRQSNPSIPAGLETAALRCLAKDPDLRFPDLAAFARALEPYASRRGVPYVERVGGIVARAHSQDRVGTHPASRTQPAHAQTPPDVSGERRTQPMPSPGIEPRLEVALVNAPTFDISENSSPSDEPASAPSLEGTRDAWGSTQKKRRTGPRIGLAVVGVLGVLATGWYLLSPRQPPAPAPLDVPASPVASAIEPEPTGSVQAPTVAILAPSESDLPAEATHAETARRPIPASNKEAPKRSRTAETKDTTTDPPATEPKPVASTEPAVHPPGGLFETRK
jgi:serine/threonine-protein kinase